MKIKGIVEKVDTESIEGWVLVEDDRGTFIDTPEINLNVNDYTIATTYALIMNKTTSSSTGSRFKFLIKDLFNYLNQNDQISVSVYGEELPVHNYGINWRCETSGQYNFEELKKKINDGYVFDIHGNIKLPLKNNPELREETIILYEELNNIFFNEFKYNLFACYGTLLGISRENSFLFNDTNFDSAYISKENDKSKVVEEFKSISKLLIKKGFVINIFNSFIQVSKPEKNIFINIYCTWIDNNSRFLISFKHIGEAFVCNRRNLKLKTISFYGSEIFIPENYQDILKQIYGEGWRNKDFGFEWESLEMSEEFLSDKDINEIYWEQYYLNSKLQEPSSFCSFVNGFLKEKYFVIDIGCGSARDSFEFLKQGNMVLGLDNSQQAINYANSIVEKDGNRGIAFQQVDISKKELLFKIFKENKKNAIDNKMNVMYYSRFFLHSIDESSQIILLETLSEFLEIGDLFVAEFRTKEDENKNKVYSNHFRRFIDESELLMQLKEISGLDEVLLFQKGTGFSIYKDEDPFLARIIVTKNSN